MALNLLYNLVVVSLFLVGFLAIIIWKFKFKTDWKIIGWGMLAWLVANLVKSLVGGVIEVFGFFALLPNFVYYVYIGLLTGIFEIAIPLLIIVRKKEIFKSFNDRVGFGVGFAGFEAIFLSVIVLLNFVAATVIVDQGIVTTGDVLTIFEFTDDVYLTSSLLAGFERMLALVMHVFATLLLFSFLYTDDLKYLIIPLLYKTFIDSMAAFFVISSDYTGYEVEVFYLALVLVSLVIYWRFKNHFHIGRPMPIKETKKKKTTRKKKAK